MKTGNVLIAFYLLAWIRPPATAAEISVQGLSLDQCIEIVLTKNPLLLSSRELIEASRARVRQALELLQPVLSYDSDLQPGPFAFAGKQETYFGINQTLEFPGRRILRGRIAARESDQVLAEAELLKVDLIFQVKQAFFGLLLAGERIQYAEQDLELARDFLVKAEAKFAAGDTAEVEVLRARVEDAKAANGVLIALNERRLAAAALNFLLARKPAEALEILDDAAKPDLDLTPARLFAIALDSRPEMRGVRAAEEAEALKARQARLSLWPDFDLGFSKHKIAGEPDSWDFTLSVRVPLFFWQPARGVVAETAAATRAILREAEHLHNLIEREVEEAVLNARAARNQIRLYEDRILEPAASVYEAFLYRFQRGEIGGIELIEARRSLLEARRAYADARLNYHVTIASLERSIGRSLEGVTYEK